MGLPNTFVFNAFAFLLMVAKVRSLGYSSFISRCFLSNLSIQASFSAGVPNLQDLIPDDLRWGWCNNNRKVQSKCNMLELSPNHSSLTWSMEKFSHETSPLYQKVWGPLFYSIKNSHHELLMCKCWKCSLFVLLILGYVDNTRFPLNVRLGPGIAVKKENM